METKDIDPNRADSESEEKIVYVRVSGKQLEDLKSIAGKGRLNQLMVHVIDMLINMRPREREDFLNGLGPIHQTSEIVERLQFANNAFERRRWAWAIEEFQRLSAGTPTVDGVFRFAQYKLAYCWAEIAAELRLHAFAELEKGAGSSNGVWDQCFDDADWSLCAALFYNARYSNSKKEDTPTASSGPSHAVVIYNLACVWSVRAQYAMERKLSTAKRKLLMNEILPKRSRGKSVSDLPIGSGKITDEQIRAYVEHALTELRRLSLTAKFDQPPSDVSFLVRNAHVDPDLTFVRGMKDFDAWTKAAAQGSILHTFAKLKKNLPDLERDAIERLHKEPMRAL